MSITGMTAEDRLAIHDLLARYAWATNTGDTPGLMDVFTDDAVVINPSQHREEGRQGLLAFAAAQFSRPEFAGRQHYVNQVVMRGDAERCEVKSYCAVQEWVRATDVRQFYRLFWYDDVCVKRGGRWYFQRRHIRPWQGEHLPWAG